MRFLLLAILLFGCKSAEKLAKERLAKEERDRQAEISLIEKTRQRFPCDTPRTTTQTITEYLSGDTTYLDSVAFIHDTTRVTVFKTKYIIDSAWVQQYRDSLAASYYAFDIAKQDASDQAKRADKAEAKLAVSEKEADLYRRIVFWGGGILAALIGAGIALKLFKTWQSLKQL